MTLAFIIRTIIIIPVIALMIFLSRVFWPIINGVGAEAESSDAVQSLWGGAPDTAMFIASIAMAFIGMGLLLWHLVAPLRTDTNPRRIRR